MAAFDFRLTGCEKRVGGFDLFWDDGPVYPDDVAFDYKSAMPMPLNTFLGKSSNCMGLIMAVILKQFLYMTRDNVKSYKILSLSAHKKVS